MKNIAMVVALLLSARTLRAAPAPPAPAAQVVGHSVDVKWTASPTANVTYNFKRSTTSGSGYITLVATLVGLESIDSNVSAGSTYFYVISAVDALGNESANSTEASATIPGATPPPPPPPPTGPQVGNRIKTLSTANIRATAVNNGFGTLYATEPAAALGTVMAVSTAAVPNVTGAVWIQVKFDSCAAAIPNCLGWMGSDNMTVVTTLPPISITIAPTSKSLLEGASQQFTATLTGTTNTAVNWTASGGSVASGLYIAGTTPGTFAVTATSVADPTKSAKATITITAPPPVITLSCLGLSTQNIPSGTSITLSATGGGGSASAVCPVP